MPRREECRPGTGTARGRDPLRRRAPAQGLASRVGAGSGPGDGGRHQAVGPALHRPMAATTGPGGRRAAEHVSGHQTGPGVLPCEVSDGARDVERAQTVHHNHLLRVSPRPWCSTPFWTRVPRLSRRLMWTAECCGRSSGSWCRSAAESWLATWSTTMHSSAARTRAKGRSRYSSHASHSRRWCTPDGGPQPAGRADRVELRALRGRISWVAVACRLRGRPSQHASVIRAGSGNGRLGSTPRRRLWTGGLGRRCGRGVMSSGKPHGYGGSALHTG